jgi:hypothetical protein
MANIINQYGQVKLGVRSTITSPTDADALAFITAAAITGATQQNAIITLVTQLKTYGIWSKMKALYPFVGGTAAQHRFNLKDPRTVNAAFYLDFLGGGTHSANGYQPNGNSYAETYFNPTTGYSVNNSAHISFYSRTNSSEIFDTEMGCYDVNNLVITTRRSDQSNNTFLFANTNNGINFVDSDSLGLYVSNRINNQANGFKNGVSKGSNTVTDNARNNRSVVICAQSSLLYGITQYSSRQCAFSSIGDGLTDAEATALYNAVQAFQTTLGRQV